MRNNYHSLPVLRETRFLPANARHSTRPVRLKTLWYTLGI
jgi:hypothetical protein